MIQHSPSRQTAAGLRDDYEVKALRQLAQPRYEADQVCRLLSLAVIYDGSGRKEAAPTGGVGLQPLRDRVLRFNRDRHIEARLDVPIELGKAVFTSAVLALETAEVAQLIQAVMMHGLDA